MCTHIFFSSLNFLFIRILLDRLSCFLNAFIACATRLLTFYLIFSQSSFCILNSWLKSERDDEKNSNKILYQLTSVYLKTKTTRKAKMRTLTNFCLVNCILIHLNVHPRQITKEAKWVKSVE